MGRFQTRDEYAADAAERLDGDPDMPSCRNHDAITDGCERCVEAFVYDWYTNGHPADYDPEP